MSGRVLLCMALGPALLVLVAGCRAYGVPQAPAPLGPPSPASPVSAAADAPGTASPQSAGAPAAPLPAAAVLHGWDRRRARVWSAGNPQALANLYLPGSSAGHADVALLRAYLDRGFRVEGMRMQVLAVQVLGHTRGRWRLRVTDRLARSVAVGHGGRVVLPRDAATTRMLTLVRRPGDHWRMARVVRLPR